MIKYPNGKIAKDVIKSNDTSRRGMTLEQDLNQSNSYYLEFNKAVIHKKPTPVQIVHVDYPKRTAAKITEAYFKTPSTTDYNGIYRGKYLDFEAKETSSKTSFPFASIHPHQIKHMQSVLEHGAIGFFIFRFSAFNEIYLVEGSKIIPSYLSAKRRSFTYEWVQTEGYLIPSSYAIPVDYLTIIDKLYF